MSYGVDGLTYLDITVFSVTARNNVTEVVFVIVPRKVKILHVRKFAFNSLADLFNWL